MKKNISINISGIIFHIEEDGYERLKEYLESINKYFSTFDGSTEIIADIESRIAEIFLAKLNEDRQVITLEDVTGLIATMGGIQDFQAVEEEIASPTSDETNAKEEDEKEEFREEASDTIGHDPKKKLYRDKNRQIIGGVASGIAHYFSIDPLWIRLIFIVFLFDVFLTFSLSALALIAYIILWIVVPESTTLKEDKKLKKIYRNPQGRVIGGVASGVATYFNIDVALVRVLFVLATLLGGSGLIAYIVLWIILPEAKSITDKVQMKGEPVTLENIESNIKSSEEAKANPKEESTIVKILLFPFRLIAIILTGLSKALGPILNFIIQFIRVILGIALTIIGVAILFSVLITGSVFLGIMAGSGVIHLGNFPVELINQIVSPLGFIAGMIVVGIPALAIMFLGISVAAKTRIPNATVGWAMFGIWLVGIIGLSFTLPNILREFRTEGEYSQTTFYNVGESQLVLDINENGYDEYPDIRIKLRGYDGTEIKVVQEYSARGASKLEANKNAEEIRYTISQEDSVLVFDSNIDFGSAPYFRNQDLFMTMYIPYGKTFIMQNDFDNLIYYSFGYQGYRSSQIIGNTWMFNPTGLECLTCSDYTSSREKRREEYESLYEENVRVSSKDKVFDLVDFDGLKISGPYKVNIVRGDNYRVVLSGLDQYLEKTEVSQDSSNISIRYDSDDNLDVHRYNRKVTVKIMCPNLSDIHLLGSVSGNISGFEEEAMYVKLDGASEIDLDADVYSLDVKLSGAAELNITGTGKELNADISTASFLNTYSYLSENVTLKASGASKARIYASEELKIEASLISEVKYRGGAKVSTVKSSAFSKVKED
jgi:phage shock protein PspC (stress-responsive transcriptional regulator)